MNRIEICYIAGRYRHYLPDNRYDRVKMAQELAAEAHWILILARAGCGWIAPLHNTIMAESVTSQEDFIRHDLAMIRAGAAAGWALLLRPGWEATSVLPESVGVRQEFTEATRLGMPVLHGAVGEDMVTQWLRDPAGCMGDE